MSRARVTRNRWRSVNLRTGSGKGIVAAEIPPRCFAITKTVRRAYNLCGPPRIKTNNVAIMPRKDANRTESPISIFLRIFGKFARVTTLSLLYWCYTYLFGCVF